MFNRVPWMQTFLQSILLLFSIGKIFINQGFKRHCEANEKTLSHVPLFFLKWHIYANTNRNVAIMFVVTSDYNVTPFPPSYWENGIEKEIF